MKRLLATFAILLSVILSACASRRVTTAPSNLSPGDPSAKVVSSASEGGSSGPEVATTLPDNGAFPTGTGAVPTMTGTASASEIVLEDNGRTFTYHVGDSFLLNLGADVYEWEVTIGDQNIVAMKIGVTVIQGAQGIFDALAPGSTTLTAVGSPQCLKSTPPCKIPTILFKVTLVVQ